MADLETLDNLIRRALPSAVLLSRCYSPNTHVWTFSVIDKEGETLVEKKSKSKERAHVALRRALKRLLVPRPDSHRRTSLKRPPGDTQRQKAHRNRQKARGRCISCSEPVALSRLGKLTRRCELHAKIHRERAAKARANV